MKFEQYPDTYSQAQMVLPLFQPLRLWTPREEKVAIRVAAPNKPVLSLPVGFSMKGGFMSVAGGERRLMIAGSIRKTVSHV